MDQESRRSRTNPPIRPYDVNMADVAREAGVSISAVSRALRGQPGVSDSTRERIRRIAAGMSYVISPEASALARQTTHRVSVVVPSIGSWFFATMLAGVEGLLRRAELDVLIFHVEGRADRQRFFEQLPIRRKVDAVIVVALPVTEEQLERLGMMGVHIVVAGGRLGSYPHVRIDDVEVGRRAVEHLVELGHERIAMIRSHDHEGVVWPPDRERTAGYREGLRRAGLPAFDDLLVTESWGVDGGRRAMRQLLSRRPLPTAVFVYSDEMAFGALRQLHEAGIGVPERMSVVAVDDHPHSDLFDLTTIRQPVQAQGATAAQITLDLLREQTTADPGPCLPTELVIRGSTGPPGASR
jgi:LacI family transcriptional regulator, repressor for deo operon, udp, cdd, tsx, nupC, and nupG